MDDRKRGMEAERSEGFLSWRRSDECEGWSGVWVLVSECLSAVLGLGLCLVMCRRENGMRFSTIGQVSNDWTWAQ